jgi:hypothetical protein
VQHIDTALLHDVVKDCCISASDYHSTYLNSKRRVTTNSGILTLVSCISSCYIQRTSEQIQGCLPVL